MLAHSLTLAGYVSPTARLNSCKLSDAADLNTRRREATGQCKNVILVHFNEPTGAQRANLKTPPLPSCFHSASTSRGFLTTTSTRLS